METSDNDLKKKLEKIRKKLMESEELNVEASRRYQVANEKLAGYLIEFIESQRGKLEEKKKVGRLLGILLRINDLRTQVFFEMVREIQSKRFPSLVLLQNMSEVYEGIISELSDYLKEDAESPNLPSLSNEPLLPEDKLQNLNICLGQLQGFVLGKLYQFL